MTDGKHLYELVDGKFIENFGLASSWWEFILRECCSEKTAYLHELDLLAYSPITVRQPVDSAS